MISRSLDASTTGPAHGGLRFVLLLLLLAGCASQPKPEPPTQLEDHSAETDYALDKVEGKLQAAADYARQGHRVIAGQVIETAQKMLPADAVREHEYLEVLKANIWSRQGEGCDAPKAARLLDTVAKSAASRKDSRLLADVYEARTQLMLSQGDKPKAAQNADAALRKLESVNAYTEQAWTARDLSFQFLDADDTALAKQYAERAWNTTTRLKDDELRLQIGIDVARLFVIVGGDAEYYFKQAYEAAHRLLDRGYGWRNIVIAAAVDAYFSNDNKVLAVRWGDRLRDRDQGLMPGLEASQLWPGDYINVMSQYAFARGKLDDRAVEAAALAMKAIESLPEDQRGDWNDLAEKLRSGLLNKALEK